MLIVMEYGNIAFFFELSFDFKASGGGNILEIYASEASCQQGDGAYDLVIGQDGTTAYKDNGNVYLKGYVDDFIIFSGAFDEIDLKALEEYYKQ